VLSAGAGFRSLINAQVNALGSNTLFIQTRVPPTTKNRAASSAAGPSTAAFSGVQITSFKQRDLDGIAKLNNVAGVYGEVIGQAVVSYGNVDKSTLYYGASAGKCQAEDDGAAQVAILGDSLAQDLFNQTDPVGQLIHVGTLNFQVIGVYNSLGFAGGGTADDSLYIPLGTAQKKLLGIDYLQIGVVQVQNINLSDVTVSQIKNLMEYNHNITDPIKDDFIVESQAQALDTFNVIFNGITILLIAIAAISLIVGGVGIMNIMYVVVTERTAEIGLKKALGATNSDILNEFLIESILVTVLGGVVGIVFGAFLGWLISLIATSAGLAWTFSVPLYAILLAVGVSAAIGISFGVLPARAASKMDPVEAMRYE
jgi:putative ABC transport system permease protein